MNKNDEKPVKLENYIQDITKKEEKEIKSQKVRKFDSFLEWLGKKRKKIKEWWKKFRYNFRKKFRYIIHRSKDTLEDIDLKKYTKKEVWYKKFIYWFSFEEGVDILDEMSVLYRRNTIIKRIILVSNLVYAIFVTFSLNVNFIIGIMLFLPAYFLNLALKRLIYDEPRTMLRQEIAMYFASSYVFLVSMIIYIKLRIDALDVMKAAINLLESGTASNADITAAISNAEVVNSISQAGYALVYYALVLMALYQNRTLLKRMFGIVFIGVTIINFLLLHQVNQVVTKFGDIFNFIFSSNMFRDIFLRSLFLGIFMIALYSTVAIAEYMSEERKKEIIRRSTLEKDFKNVIKDVFNVIEVFNASNVYEDISHATRVGNVAKKLSSIMGLEPNISDEIYDFSLVHFTEMDKLSIQDFDDDDMLEADDYQLIKSKTDVGSLIIKRLELNQLCEDMVRSVFEKWDDLSILQKHIDNKLSLNNQIILLADLYDTLRTPRPYKKGLRHKDALAYINKEYFKYFNEDILDRFNKYEMEFREMFKK